MFKFNFLDSGEDTSNTISNQNEVVWLDSKEVIPQDVNLQLSDQTSYNNFICTKNNIIIKYLSSDGIIKSINEKSQNAIVYAEKNHSDLVTGVYEGGLKIWECTQDLVNFILADEICFKDKKILDLGCGVGILGILALLSGGYVYFQDYNIDVITSVTIPNVVLNTENDPSILNSSKFYFGDWQSFLNIMRNNDIKFDYILSSETIYNMDNYEKLHSVFVHCLKKNGVVYLAAKTYYFGVGGGLRLFEDFVTSRNLLSFKSCWICSNGIGREIIKLTLK